MKGIYLSETLKSPSTSTGCGKKKGRRSTSLDYDLHEIINTPAAQKRRQKSRGYLVFLVALVIITLQFAASPVLSASLNKRSTDQSADVCGTNEICRSNIYHSSTRNLQYVLHSSCKCQSPNKSCNLAEDDISISAYICRCRDH